MLTLSPAAGAPDRVTFMGTSRNGHDVTAMTGLLSARDREMPLTVVGHEMAGVTKAQPFGFTPPPPVNSSHFLGNRLEVDEPVAVDVAVIVDVGVAVRVFVEVALEVAVAVAVADLVHGAPVGALELVAVDLAEKVEVLRDVSETEKTGLKLEVNDSLLDKQVEKDGVADTHAVVVPHIEEVAHMEDVVQAE
jgi:hypothetical protein